MDNILSITHKGIYTKKAANKPFVNLCLGDSNEEAGCPTKEDNTAGGGKSKEVSTRTDEDDIDNNFPMYYNNRQRVPTMNIMKKVEIKKTQKKN